MQALPITLRRSAFGTCAALRALSTAMGTFIPLTTQRIRLASPTSTVSHLTKKGEKTIQRHCAKHGTKQGQMDINTWQNKAADRPRLRRLNLRQTVYSTRSRNDRGEMRGRCLNIFTSPFHLTPPAHTGTRTTGQESGSWVASGHDQPLEDVILVSTDR